MYDVLGRQQHFIQRVSFKVQSV